jgi:hypothetical protein
MDYAEKYGLMLHTFIDTVGGDPFAASAAKLQSWLIARCQARMLRRLAKIICSFLLSMCYDRLYAEPNKRGHCSKVYHLEAALG